MSQKAYHDVVRARQGLLTWHRLRAGHWAGRGAAGPTYEVKRDNPTQSWRVVFDGNTLVDGGLKVLGHAQDSAQRHYTKARGGAPLEPEVSAAVTTKPWKWDRARAQWVPVGGWNEPHRLVVMKRAAHPWRAYVSGTLMSIHDSADDAKAALEGWLARAAEVVASGSAMAILAGAAARVAGRLREREVERTTREQYVERVREALQLHDALSIPSDEYIKALEEIAGEVAGMLQAAREEAEDVGP